MTGAAPATEPGLSARVLGSVSLAVDGVPVPLRGARRRLLVALLLAEAGRPVGVGRIAEALRDGTLSSASDPANAVHAHATRLRRLLDPTGTRSRHWVGSGAEGYRLLPDRLDLADYQQRARAARELAAAQPERAVEAAEEALAGWATPFGDLAGEAPLADLSRRLEEGHRSLEETWASLVVDLGRGGEHADRLASLARAESTREHRWSLAMRALVQAGRQADALALYDEARTTLAEELGIDPGADLRATHHAVLTQDPALTRPLRRVPTAVPRGGDRFVGRGDELGALDGLAARSRVVTVAGLGGLGKSRLVAEWLATSGRGPSSRWVDLRGAAPEGVAARLAAELGLALVDDRPGHALEMVEAAVRGRTTLLVLDNADEVGDSVAEVVARLTASVPELAVLITSRQPVGLSEERVVSLGPLPQPAPGESLRGTAAELAYERLGPSATEAAAREIAEAAGGLPVAVEMRAARRRQDAGESEPDDRPRRPAAHGDPVGQAVEDALLHLSPDARELFRCSLHLPGGMSSQLAAAMGAGGPEGAPALGRAGAATRARVLRELVASSLLVTATTDRGMRYRTLQPVVDVCRPGTTPDEEAATVRRLGDWVRTRMRTSYFEAPDPASVRLVAEEWINLDSGLQWLARHRPGRLLDLAVLLPDVWDLTALAAEGHRWLRQGLELSAEADEVSRPLQVRALVALNNSMGLAHTAARGEEVDEALDLLRATGDRDGDLWGVAQAQRAIVTGWRGDLPAMEEAVGEVRRVAAGAGSPWFDGIADELDGMACLPRGRPLDGVARCLEAAARFEATGDVDGACNATYFACVLARLGRMAAPELERLLEQGRERAEATQATKARALIAGEAARFGLSQGRADRAEELASALTLTEQAGNLHHAAVGRRDLGLLLLREGRTSAAEHQLRAAARHLLDYDLGAGAVALAALAATHGGRARDTLAACAWALADSGSGTPVTADDRASVAALAGPRPPSVPSVAEATRRGRDVLGLSAVPPGPLLPAEPTVQAG